jgi:hypothetical protein
MTKKRLSSKTGLTRTATHSSRTGSDALISQLTDFASLLQTTVFQYTGEVSLQLTPKPAALEGKHAASLVIELFGSEVVRPIFVEGRGDSPHAALVDLMTAVRDRAGSLKGFF